MRPTEQEVMVIGKTTCDSSERSGQPHQGEPSGEAPGGGEGGGSGGQEAEGGGGGLGARFPRKASLSPGEQAGTG